VGPRAGLDAVEKRKISGRPVRRYTVSYILFNVYRIEMRTVNIKYIELMTVYNDV
jgi:hypothetical protein